MSHINKVIDADPHFVIDINTRNIKNVSQTKTSLVQYDHNSERFSFTLPRLIEGHDMMECNSVQVHYFSSANPDTKGVYDITDMAICEKDAENVCCTWLISQNVTQTAGALQFMLRFACVADDGTVEYAWHTNTFTGIFITAGMNNAEAVVEQYADILEQWKTQFFDESAEGVENINTAKVAAVAEIATARSEVLSAIETKGNDVAASLPEDYSTLSKDVESMSEAIPTENIFDADILLATDGVTKKDGIYSFTANKFNPQGVDVFTDFEPGEIYTVSLKAKTDGKVSTDGKGLYIKFLYSNGANGTTQMPNETQGWEKFTLTSDGRDIKAMQVGYNTKGGNTWHLAEIMLVKGKGTETEYIPPFRKIANDIVARGAIQGYQTSILAMKYSNNVIERENHLRRLHYYNAEKDIWYGSEWIEKVAGVTAINSEGDESLHTEMPIQSKMRRCIIKDGILQYYLHSENSALKEDGTNAMLDGSHGDVCVEIPEFFYKFEEETVPEGRKIRLKISEQGINGFTYSPKMYVGAFEATMNHESGILASVCTTTFAETQEEVKVTSDSDYTESNDGISLGIKTVVSKTGHTTNADVYRGGNNNSSYDNITDEADADYWLNQLGIPVAKLSRNDYRNAQDTANGKLMYTYDAHKALFILSFVEFKMKNIQQAAGLGKGATTYNKYSAFKQWRHETTESVLPCGYTIGLGNKSGEVYVKMQNVPVSIEGDYPNADMTTATRGNIWIPVMSYRGIENYYGHLYKTIDQITVVTELTNPIEYRPEDNYTYRFTSYYYQRNPFLCNNNLYEAELIGTYKFANRTNNVSSMIFGMDGHILPIDTTVNGGGQNEKWYCDGCEFGFKNPPIPMEVNVNGSMINNWLPGRNFMVAVYPTDGSEVRNSNGTRITYLNVR